MKWLQKVTKLKLAPSSVLIFQTTILIKSHILSVFEDHKKLEFYRLVGTSKTSIFHLKHSKNITFML